jgi:rhodanese-related sulfurtransferase
MNEKILRRANLSLNLLLIGAALALAGYGVRSYLLGKAQGQAARKRNAGINGVDEINFGSGNYALLFALDTKCGFCRAAAPFYQKAIHERGSNSNVRLVALFSQSPGAGRNYAEGLGLQFDEVEQANLDAFQVRGTPTLILSDSNGKVLRRWVGALSAQQQQEILQVVRGNVGVAVATNGVQPETAEATGGNQKQVAGVATTPAAAISDENAFPLGLPSVIKPQEFQAALHGRKGITVLDIDERDDYARGHIQGAMNIPIDELYVRSWNELPKTNYIVIYSRSRSDVPLRMANNVLAGAGYEHIAMLADGLKDWEANSLPAPGSGH